MSCDGHETHHPRARTARLACQTSPNTPLRPEAVGDGPVTFNKQVVRVFQQHCQPCHRYAVGVSTVVVNGEVVVDGGDHTGALPGRVVRRS